MTGAGVSRSSSPPRAVVSSTIAITASSFYTEFLEELSAQGYEVHVVTSPGPRFEALNEVAAHVHALPMHRGVSPLHDLIGLVRWVVLLCRLRPRLVLGGTPKAGLLSMLAGRLTGVPHRTYLLQGLRLEGATGRQRQLLGWMERIASWCSQRVVAVSPSLASEFTRLGLNSGRPVVIPHCGSSHGVDTEHFSPRPRDLALLGELNLVPEVPVAVFIGRLTADKGPETLIHALTMLADQGVQLQLLVIGAQDEPDSQQYVAALEHLGASIRVRVLDQTADVRPYLALADLLVLPTKREGMPNVVLEASAMALPVVTTTATGAVDSVIDGVTGLLVEATDSAAMAQALLALVTDAELRDRLGRAARERVVRDYQPIDVARSIVEHATGD